MKKIHLVSNAHLDPVWLWDWEEGAAEAISTFKIAADFCEEYDGFIFNHNEVVLYQWVEEFAPELFKRIQKLVAKGKWHIMGGWYLQPDCNMPSGESLVRHILLGRNYFKDRFKKEPSTAINFDPFGHSRGIVQLLVKSGYDSYLFCRPQQQDCPLENDAFVWEGYDGSKVKALRAFDMYFSLHGDAVPKVRRCIDKYPDWNSNIVLWGLGNHGGGPSRAELEALNTFAAENRKKIRIVHSTPEKFFKELDTAKLPVFKKPLNKWAIGCYTSQIRIKLQHRKLEGELFSTEKMVSDAWSRGLVEYPETELDKAGQILAYSEFHDILPGSSIQKVEETSLRQIDHGLDILARLKAKAFFALSRNQPPASNGMIPVFVYNPHPYPVKTIISCEFNLPVQNWAGKTFFRVEALDSGRALPTQVEQEDGNLRLEWRKKVVFQAELKPSRMNRFDCRLIEVPNRPEPEIREINSRLTVRCPEKTVVINTETGLLESYKVGDHEFIGRPSCLPIVLDDDEDSWKMFEQKFGEKNGEFKALSEKEAACYSGSRKSALAPVRVIEDGEARCVIEALLGYGKSYMCVRYAIPKNGTGIDISIRVNWAEKDKLLKLAFNPAGKNNEITGQVVFGSECFPPDSQEFCHQKWLIARDKDTDTSLCIINNGIHGANFRKNEIGLTLLRSTAYSGHPFPGKDVVPQDRFIPRQEQGERCYSFRLDAGDARKIRDSADREAQTMNEEQMILSFFPCPSDSNSFSEFLKLSDTIVLVTAVKKTVGKNNTLIIRLFEPTGRRRSTTLISDLLGIRKTIKLKPFEIKTLEIGLKTKTVREVSLMEK